MVEVVEQKLVRMAYFPMLFPFLQTIVYQGSSEMSIIRFTLREILAISLGYLLLMRYNEVVAYLI
jgi:hypothetical protein